MSEVAFTFGVGDYAEAAEVCARRWRVVNGQDLIVLGPEYVDVRWPVEWQRLLAFRLFPDVDRIVMVDADVWAERPMVWNDAVDFEVGSDVWEFCRPLAEPLCLDRYFNSGLWRASRAMEETFRGALGMFGLPGMGGQCGDQSALNFMCGRLGARVGWLEPGVHQLLFPFRDMPFELGALRQKYPGAGNFHFTSMKARGGEIGRVMRSLEVEA